MSQGFVHPSIKAAINAFKEKLALHFDVNQTFLFGSMARHTEHAESDADVAVVLNGETGKFIDTKFAMDDLAYEVLLDTGVRIQPLPIWLNDWENPTGYPNPSLLFNIQREGLLITDAK
jgi:predicted nucleotidyltransferase